MKTVQERIASFPRRIVVDLAGFACATRWGVVDPGDRGYQPLYLRNPDGWTLEELDKLNQHVNGARPPTPAEREAALIGSMFGWDCPGADPESYIVQVKLRNKEKANVSSTD